MGADALWREKGDGGKARGRGVRWMGDWADDDRPKLADDFAGWLLAASLAAGTGWDCAAVRRRLWVEWLGEGRTSQSASHITECIRRANERVISFPGPRYRQRRPSFNPRLSLSLSHEPWLSLFRATSTMFKPSSALILELQTWATCPCHLGRGCLHACRHTQSY